MQPKSLLFADHTREELNALAPKVLLVLPLGATEQHGPHLPVGTDYYVVEHLAREAAARLAPEFPVLVGPALPFGSSDHHLPFGGTFSLSTEVYYRVLCDLIRSLATCGFRRMFLLNGHGGNHELIQLAARDLALTKEISVGAASYWNLSWERLIETGAHKQARLPGHAGRFETSLMLALRGQYVAPKRPHRENVPDSDPKAAISPYRMERHGSWQAIEGYTDSPDTASVELGETYFPILIDTVANALREFYRALEK